MSALAFDLPAALEAREPPEARGLARDGVRLMVSERASGRIEHAVFRDVATLLHAGDLLVVNVSATMPAAVTARRGDRGRAVVHFSTRAPRLEDRWRVVELRSADGARPAGAAAGERLVLRGGAALELVAPYASGPRLMLARLDGAESVEEYLRRHGRPIRYGYVRRGWPLEAYQNVYAIAPGSAEMPSAGRPFTHELITGLVARGVGVAPITLHTGISSPEAHEPPYPEQYIVPAATARLVDSCPGRVIAVGTTVVRALESAAGPDGRVHEAAGWTGHVVTPEQPPRVVDGLITGWHEPGASHLELLRAVAGEQLLARSYAVALERRYRWHEFGDSLLIVP